MRLVTALASKGLTLTSTLREMNLGPSGRETALQQLTTRDVVMIPDLFEPHSGFVMPKDPWENGAASASASAFTTSTLPPSSQPRPQPQPQP